MIAWAKARIASWGPYWTLPLLPALYACVLALFGELRAEHVVLGVFTALVAFIGPRTKRFLEEFWPIVAVGIGYDLVRYLRPYFVTPERVLGCELRSAELALFSVSPERTLQDLAAAYHRPALDLFFAVPYTIFAYVALLYAGYLFFTDRRRMSVFVRAFAIANYVSFFCWLVVPAAPPWYLRAHGCLIDASALPNPAGLARVDALLGIDYFHAFYSRASSIFGALPSMHCAYPMLGLFSAWRFAGWKARSIHVVYAIAMACGAVYLDHHWVIDVLAGWATAAFAVWLAERLVERATTQAAPRTSVPPSAPADPAPPELSQA